MPPDKTEELGSSPAPHQAKKMPNTTSSKANKDTSGAFNTLAQATDNKHGMASCTKPSKASYATSEATAWKGMDMGRVTKHEMAAPINTPGARSTDRPRTAAR